MTVDSKVKSANQRIDQWMAAEGEKVETEKEIKPPEADKPISGNQIPGGVTIILEILMLAWILLARPCKNENHSQARHWYIPVTRAMMTRLNWKMRQFSKIT